VELFEEIRREYEHGVGTVKGVARKLGVTGAWCGKLWAMRFPDRSESQKGRGPHWGRRSSSSTRSKSRIEKLHASNGTPLIAIRA
jgi:hypothetical protein